MARAERKCATCKNYLPPNGSCVELPGHFGGDDCCELWGSKSPKCGICGGKAVERKFWLVCLKNKSHFVNGEGDWCEE